MYVKAIQGEAEARPKQAKRQVLHEQQEEKEKKINAFERVCVCALVCSDDDDAN